MNKKAVISFVWLFSIFSGILYCAFFAPQYLGSGEGFGYALFACIVGMIKYAGDFQKKEC